MKAKLAAVFTAMVGLVVCAPAQNMVEYSTLSTQSAKALAAPAAPAPKSHKVTQGTTGKPAGANGKVQVWQEKGARAKDVAPAKPTPPAVFILSNGQHVEASDYVVTMDGVRLNDSGNPRTIPLNDVNLSATQAANHERGVDLQFPTNKGQMMLSF